MSKSVILGWVVLTGKNMAQISNGISNPVVAGINTNSKQYKATVKKMMSAGNGAMYGNIQGIKRYEAPWK